MLYMNKKTKLTVAMVLISLDGLIIRLEADEFTNITCTLFHCRVIVVDFLNRYAIHQKAGETKS